MSFGFSMFFFLCECWIPSLNYLSWVTPLPTDSHQRSQVSPVDNDRCGLTHRNLYYSSDEMLNKICKMLCNGDRKKKSNSIWFKGKIKMLGHRNAHCFVFIKYSLVLTFGGYFKQLLILNSQSDLGEIVVFFVNWVHNKQTSHSLSRYEEYNLSQLDNDETHEITI